MWALFSLEILQAGGSEGVNSNTFFCFNSSSLHTTTSMKHQAGTTITRGDIKTSA